MSTLATTGGMSVVKTKIDNRIVRTLITGAPGWLGTRFVEVLTDPASDLRKYSGAAERHVRVLVLPGTDTSPLSREKIEIIEGDVLDPQSLEKVMRDIDTVFHCVGLIHPKRVKDLFRVNVDGTRNMLEAAAKCGVKRFIYISSNSPAGLNDSRERLLTEEDTSHPYMAYGRSKWEAEKLVRGFHRQGKLETVILRPCWFYGPGMGQPERQLRFFRMMHRGNPILFGNGNNLRSMSYLDNTIQGMLLAEKIPEANGQTYWIADEHPYTTTEIYHAIAKVFGTPLKPRKVPAVCSWGCRVVDRILQTFGLYITEFHVAGEMDRDIACDISKAKRELGYRPTVSLEEGMRRSIEWARRYQGFEI